MEKTLIQCRVINLKWLMTKTAGPFTGTTRGYLRIKPRQGGNVRGKKIYTGVLKLCGSVMWWRQFAEGLDGGRHAVKLIYRL